MASGPDGTVKICEGFLTASGGGALKLQIHRVDLLPHLTRNQLPNGARVFSCSRKARKNRIRIFQVEGQKADYVFTSRFSITLLKEILVAGRENQRLPLFGDARRKVRRHVEVYFNKARVVLGPFNITADPVKRGGDPTEHQSPPSTIQQSLLPPPWEEFTTREPRRSATRQRPPGMT